MSLDGLDIFHTRLASNYRVGIFLFFSNQSLRAGMRPFPLVCGSAREPVALDLYGALASLADTGPAISSA